MNSSLSKVFVAICGSSLVNLSSAVKVGGFSFTAAPPRFFEFVYGINQQKFTGKNQFSSEDIAHAKSFGDDLDEVIKKAAPLTKRGCFSGGSSNHELVELKTKIDTWKATGREDLKRAAGLFYLQNHRKILKQSGLSTHPFIVGDHLDGGVQKRLRNALQIALREELFAFDPLAHPSDDAHELQTDYARKEDAFVSQLQEFMLFGFTHGFHLGFKADSPSWLANVTNAGKFFDAAAAEDFTWKAFVRGNIKDIVRAAAGASTRCFWNLPVGKKSSRKFLSAPRKFIILI